MSSKFVHLRLHSEYSLIDGLVKIKPLVNKISDMQMPAVALTDHMNLFALVKFQKACLGKGIKPIFGADILLENEDPEGLPHNFTLLVQDKSGYYNLTEIISSAYLENQKLGQPIVSREVVNQYNRGLIALSGGRTGEIGRALLAGHRELAKKYLQEWGTLFDNRFYLELQRTGRENEEAYIYEAVELALAHQCPVVATNDVRFISSEDFEAHEARVCIHQGRTLDDPRRSRDYSEQQCLRSEEEMLALFEDIPEAIQNSVEIAKRCNFIIELGKNYLPNYPIPDGMTIEQFFELESRKGLEERLDTILDASSSDYEDKRQIYFDRLQFELDIINQMGFPGYFLIVMDFIKWAKNNAVPVGPGRGSGAGSLVAYSLKITDLDPIEYDLLFERFLNPERVSMPDFDVDFCMDGRDRVIEYVAETYGRQSVSQIITFGTMAAKAVVRDVARVQGKSYSLGDRLSKMIPFEVGMTLTKALEQEEALREYLEQDDEAAEIMEMAFKLEGMTRNVGKHAGGVVIAPTQLTDFSPLYCDEYGNNLVTQYDKDDVEQVGLVKFDFLGLRTLTIVDWAVETINQTLSKAGEPLLDINHIPLEDEASFKLLQRADTTAVFQLESRGMKDLIRRLLPSCFEDIVALVALFRPGPLQSGMVDDFINRKHGRSEVEYPHPDLGPVLKNTYGVILYQEQVMQIAQVLAKYSLGQADMLRRAMGKKKPEEMAKQRKIFSQGAKENNIDEATATYVFDLMEKFAGYGFNKSHSAAYALVSYQTLWLKTHYPSAFMAAVLSADMDNTDKVVILIEDCRASDLSIVPPSVNGSEYRFTVDQMDRIVYGLGAVKGVGEGPVGTILKARAEGGEFKDLFEFCRRVDLKKLNRRTLEALIRAGAMDCFGKTRAVLMASLEEAIKSAEQYHNNQASGMMDLFGGNEDSTPVQIEYTQVPNWSDDVRLKGEKETLGLYLTGHPIDQYEHELKYFVSNRIVDLKPQRNVKSSVAGLVIAQRTMRSKKGDKISFLTLDDRTARIEVSVFSEAYEKFSELLVKDNVLVVEGEVSQDDFSGNLKMRALDIRDIQEARKAYAKRVVLQINGADFNAERVNILRETLNEYRQGHCIVSVDYCNATESARINLGQNWRVKPEGQLINSLKKIQGIQSVSVRYQ